MAKVSIDMRQGLKTVRAKLTGRRLAVGKSASFQVAYGTDYGIYVHEDLSMNHPRGGQAKFVEEPARTGRPTMQGIIASTLQPSRKRSLADAVRRAAQWLLDASQRLVPVDTGRLKRSGRVVG